MYRYAMSTRAVVGRRFDTKLCPERVTFIDIERWAARAMGDHHEDPLPEMPFTSAVQQADEVDGDGWALCGWCQTPCAGERYLAQVYGAVYAHCNDRCRGEHIDQYQYDLEVETTEAGELDPNQLALALGDVAGVEAAMPTR